MFHIFIVFTRFFFETGKFHFCSRLFALPFSSSYIVMNGPAYLVYIYIILFVEFPRHLTVVRSKWRQVENHFNNSNKVDGV